MTTSGRQIGRTLFVGIGSPHGDDMVGWHVAARLADERASGLEIRSASKPDDLLDWLGGSTELIVCDACRFPERRGQVMKFSWPSEEFVQIPTRSSHEFSLPAVLNLAQLLGSLPPRVTIWCVAIGEPAPGGAISPEAQAGVEEAARQIAEVHGRNQQHA